MSPRRMFRSGFLGIRGFKIKKKNLFLYRTHTAGTRRCFFSFFSSLPDDNNAV